MKGILINSLELAGKKYTYSDITKGIIGSSLPVDRFYGGRVTRFGKTTDGLLLCLEKNLEEVIDIFVDFDSLEKVSGKAIRAIATKVKEKVLFRTPEDEREAKEAEMDIPAEAKKSELQEYILKYAADIIE